MTDFRFRKQMRRSLDVAEVCYPAPLCLPSDPDGGVPTTSIVTGTANVAPLIALCNAALPDDDPRKITQMDVDLMGVAVERLRENCIDDDPSQKKLVEVALRRLAIVADVLCSYLPPMET